VVGRIDDLERLDDGRFSLRRCGCKNPRAAEKEREGTPDGRQRLLMTPSTGADPFNLAKNAFQLSLDGRDCGSRVGHG
jgi:hypothetical protein